jgi:hypothetical protein
MFEMVKFASFVEYIDSAFQSSKNVGKRHE